MPVGFMAVDRKPVSSPICGDGPLAAPVLPKSGFLEADLRLKLVEDCCEESHL